MIIKLKNKKTQYLINEKRRGMSPPTPLQSPYILGASINSQGVSIGYINFTLSAYPGTWNTSKGAPKITHQWVGYDPNTFAMTVLSTVSAATSSPSKLTITGNLSSYLLGFLETASLSGLSATNTTQPTSIKISLSSSPPLMVNNAALLSGVDFYPGSVIYKPTYIWSSSLNFTVSGEWYKNSLPTGVRTSTYSNTQNKDTIYWVESCIDSNGGISVYNPEKQGVNSAGRIVDSTMYSYLSAIQQGVLSRKASLSGGAKYMNTFSFKNSAAKIFVRNPLLWANDLTQQLTTCVVYKEGVPKSAFSYGGVLITPRHVLYCNHAHPWAAGTWPVNPNTTTPCVLWFVDSNNNAISAIQTYQLQVSAADLNVAVLDRDVAAAGISVTSLIRLGSTSWLRFLYRNALNSIGDNYYYPRPPENILSGTSLSAVPYFAMSQGVGRVTQEQPCGTAVSDYPRYNDIMLYINPHTSLKYGLYNNFRYCAWTGDSGTPVFTVLNDKIYLINILSGNWVGDKIPEINDAITRVDAGAIALGRLSAYTGYTIDWYDPF